MTDSAITPRRALRVEVPSQSSIPTRDDAPSCEAKSGHSVPAVHPSPGGPVGAEDEASTPRPQAGLSDVGAACRTTERSSLLLTDVEHFVNGPSTTIAAPSGTRPRALARLDARVTVRFASAERAELDRRAQQLHTTASKLLRATVLDGLDARRHEIDKLLHHAQRGYDAPSPMDAAAVEQLRRIGSNLNQATRALNTLARSGREGTSLDDIAVALRDVAASLCELQRAVGVDVT